jgi:hypothetical protein
MSSSRSVSVPPAVYAKLEAVARRFDVSIARALEIVLAGVIEIDARPERDVSWSMRDKRRG